MNKYLDRLKAKANRLPLEPGVYIMKNKDGEIIYVGKAKKLKNRVSQYFGAGNQHSDKVRKMVENVFDFDYIVCSSEYEALMLECSQIKQHSPKYNILLKDDKGYSYIKITNDKWPKITAEKQTADDGATYLGPYYSFFVIRNTVDEANKAFKLQQCNKKFPRDFGKERPCLNHYIDACQAPCSGKLSNVEYRESVNQAINFIKSGAVVSVEELKKEMEHAAENLEFEKAAKLRDKIKAIGRITEKQRIVECSYKRQDIIAVAQSDKKSCVEVLIFKNNRLFDTESFIIDDIQPVPEITAEFIKSYYRLKDDIPPRVLIHFDCEDRDLLSRLLSEKAGRNVEIFLPQKADGRKLADMCYRNAAESLAQSMGRAGKVTAALDELKNLLGLQNVPKYIESYDISHTSGSANVAGMVVFKDGEPYKRAYRRFKIKTFKGQDDCRSMQEVISRRLDEYEADKGEEGFGTLPDLILLDGGDLQLNAVLQVLASRGYNIPTFGMVKDSKHKTRAIAAGGRDIEIKTTRKVYTLVYNIQEEVHRFAISYHHNSAKKSSFNLELTEIDGIGKIKAKNLMKHFKRITAIREATQSELEECDSISKQDAERIYYFYHKIQ